MISTPVPEAGLFARSLADFGRREPLPSGAIERIRERAFERFSEREWLDPSGEAWKHTPLAAIAATPYAPADGTNAPPASFDAIPGIEWTKDAHRLVFVNGRFAPALSRFPGGPGVRAEDLRSAIERDSAAVESMLERPLPSEDGMTLLNTASITDGAVITVPDGFAAAEPLHVVFWADSAEPIAIFPRNLIRVGKSAGIRLVVTWAGTGASLTSALTQILVGENASLEMVTLQRQGTGASHLSMTAVDQERNSRFRSHLFSLGASVARDEIHATLAGEGADCVLNGLFVTEGTQRADLHTIVDHVRPHGTSRQTYRGILDGHSRAAFTGRVIVRPDAQKTDAEQSNKNLLLSGDALVNSTPALEIRANDVKCKHGSTTGQLDADALFYLRSRGLSMESARSLLTYAFASDLVRRVPAGAVRAAVDRALHERMPQAPAIAEIAP